MNNIWLAFITGLTSGGISCLAVQGGLLTSSLVTNDEEELAKKKKYLKIGLFLFAKLIAYTLLGFFLGLLGSKLILTAGVLGWMQIAAGLFMLATAARLLNLHPIFRYAQIQPPKFALRFLREESRNKSFFAPFLMGLLTVLIPCGVTQAMMALAVASANPFFGAGIMFAFILGTSPVFFALGYAALELLKKKWFNLAAGLAIAVLGIVSLNSGQNLRGSAHTLQNYWRVITTSGAQKEVLAGTDTEGKQEVVIEVLNNGYKSSTSTLKVNVPVVLKLSTNNTQGCARAFTIPAYNISKILPSTGSETLEFTPTKLGRLTYTCSMGMYSGQFTVVN